MSRISPLSAARWRVVAARHARRLRKVALSDLVLALDVGRQLPLQMQNLVFEQDFFLFEALQL